MSLPAWLDKEQKTPDRIRSLNREVERAHGSVVPRSEADRWPWVVATLVVQRILGSRTSFSAADRAAIVSVTCSAMFDQQHRDALSAAGEMFMLDRPPNYAKVEVARAQLLREWIRAEVRASKGPPEERRRQVLDEVTARRAERAAETLHRALKQRKQVDKRIEKWKRKVSYYRKRGLLPEFGSLEDAAARALGRKT